jgi:hypothetical protein
VSGELAPREEAARAVVDFDRGLRNPDRAVDPVGELFRVLGAAADLHAREARAERVRWRNRPEAKAARSAAARKAAETRAARAAAERAVREAEAERDARVPAVHCLHMDFVPYGGGETECVLEPGHAGEDHEDLDGHVWPNECNEADCGEACGF